MARYFIVLALFPVIPTAAVAQDMPLSQILIDGEGWKKVENAGAKPKPARISPPTRAGDYTLTVVTYSPDRSTMFVVIPGKRFLWAAPANIDGKAASPGAPYAPLRLPRTDKSLDVTALATDCDGRIYAATEIGVQVFDPTGRLCGVLTPAAPGKPEHMAFDGDKLTLWHGDMKYARKLNTRGANAGGMP